MFLAAERGCNHRSISRSSQPATSDHCLQVPKRKPNGNTTNLPRCFCFRSRGELEMIVTLNKIASTWEYTLVSWFNESIGFCTNTLQNAQMDYQGQGNTIDVFLWFMKLRSRYHQIAWTDQLTSAKLAWDPCGRRLQGFRRENWCSQSCWHDKS